MKTLTITLRTTDAPMPIADPPHVAFKGFRLTITRPDGSQAYPPIEDKLTWVFSNLAEGGTYKLLAEAVDDQGRTIQALAEASLTVPAAATYRRLDGFDAAWS